jgi:1-acyl-sn-glycerol-3-phosphate acyltransferase
MKKLLYILYQPYKFLIYLPFLLLSTFLLGILAVILVFVSTPRIASQVCGVTWARLNSYLTPMPVKVLGRENIDKKQSYVIVSNHQSHYDIFVLYGFLGVDFKWVMKMELRKIPVFGVACEKVEHIYIDRSNSKAALESLNRAKEIIVDGTSVIFFAEGTRSMTGELGDFKKGAFFMALDLGIPILPVTIIGTRNVLPPKTKRLMPGRAKMIIHKPIEVEGYSMETISDLMADVRSVIQSGLDEYGG